ncbi:Hypothetical predicted protein [Cloeon dipterum]|uniref:Uncharacterized protein n=1 Tax=Cloeon dipterum TaxID=197152 RepID=A0A8S1DMD8_9INSE|nr:Hypothetical predicted protein [Cloeon dipterum]
MNRISPVGDWFGAAHASGQKKYILKRSIQWNCFGSVRLLIDCLLLQLKICAKRSVRGADRPTLPTLPIVGIDCGVS